MIRVLAVPVLLLTACGGPPATRTVDYEAAKRQLALRETRTVDPALAAAGRDLLEGFPDQLDEGSFRPGDALLFAIESWDATSVRRWFLLLETTDDPVPPAGEVTLRRRLDGRQFERTLQTDHATVRARVFDEARRLHRDARSVVPRIVFETGLFPYALAARGHPIDAGPARTARPLFLRQQEWGTILFAHLLDALADNAALRYQMQRLAVMPDLTELIGLIGARLQVNAGLAHPRLVDAAPGQPPGTQRLECTVSVWRDRPTVLIHYRLAPAVGPLAMAAGIVGATGHDADAPERHFVAQLIAVRQAPPP